MKNETLITQARHLFVVLNSEQYKSAMKDKVRFNRLYPIVGHAFRRYMRRLNQSVSVVR